MQHRDDQERDRRCETETDDLGGVTEQRLEQIVERRLADGAQAQRGERDPELARRQVRVDVVDRVLSGFGAGPALARELSHLRGS